MKKVKISILSLFGLLFFATSAFGQNRVVIDNNSKSVAFSKDNKTWGLEVGGKEVFSPQYKSVDYQNGLYILENINGLWRVADVTASEGNIKGNMKLGNWIKASGVKITEDFVLFEKANGGTDALIYDRSTWQQVKATQTTSDNIYKETKAANANKGTSYDPTSAQQKVAVKKAAEASSAAPFGTFRFRTNSEGKQELIVDDKVMFTADSFDLFLDEAFSFDGPVVSNNVKFYKQSGRWIFRVEKVDWSKSKFGLYVLDIDNKDGQKVVEGKLTIPIKYKGVWHHQSGYAKCEMDGFKEEYRDVNGILRDLATREPLKEN